MNDLTPINEIEHMADIVARSGMFGVKSATQAAALMLVAQAEGRPPVIAARDYHIIDGKPTLKADAMLARFQEAGGTIAWEELTERRACAVFSHPAGGSLKLEWTVEMARAAGLANKRGPWQQFPRAMLKARLISDGIRAVFPGAICGVYTPEEVNDMEPERTPRQAEAVEVAQEAPADAQAAVSEPAPATTAKRGKTSPAARLKAAAKAAAVEVSAEPLEPAPKDGAEAIAERMAAKAAAKEPAKRGTADWIEDARERVAIGATAAELKQDAIAEFGKPIPDDIHAFLMDVWTNQQAAQAAPEPDPDDPGPVEG